MDGEVQKELAKGLQDIDAKRQDDATTLMKKAQETLAELQKHEQNLASVAQSVDVKIRSFLEHIQQYLLGILAKNESLRKTHCLLLQLLANTLQKVTDTIHGPIEKMKLATSMNLETCDIFKEVTSTNISKEINNVSQDVILNLEAILNLLSVPPSTFEGVPGGVKAIQIDDDENDKEDKEMEDVNVGDGNEEKKETKATGDEEKKLTDNIPKETLKAPTPPSSSK